MPHHLYQDRRKEKKEGKKERRKESDKLWLTRKFLKYIYLTKDLYLEAER